MEVLARVPVLASQAPEQGMPRGACLPFKLELPENQAQGACGFAERWAWGKVWVEGQGNCWSICCAHGCWAARWPMGGWTVGHVRGQLMGTGLMTKASTLSPASVSACPRW